MNIIKVYSNVDGVFHSKYKVAFEFGRRRELVIRRNSSIKNRLADVYYYSPAGFKMRSMRNVQRWLDMYGDGQISLENFTFNQLVPNVA